jgi:hypothetical protein
MPSARRRPPAIRSGHPPRRLVIVDEARTLLRDGEGAKFLYRLSKSARKRRAGLAVITQDVGDLLGTDLGQAVIANAATQVLLRQAPQAVVVVSDAFGLTAGEARLLLGARRGEGLLLSGTHRVGFQPWPPRRNTSSASETWNCPTTADLSSPIPTIHRTFRSTKPGPQGRQTLAARSPFALQERSP